MQDSSEAPFRYVFGPVLSRRLGRSLGVDLIPFKACTYDCIYCQLGVTTDKRAEREEFVPLDAVVREVERKLASSIRPDYVTLAGSGEPTLYARLGEFIGRVKSFCPAPVAVITNGSLLWRADVRSELHDADLVIPSLDAGTPEAFAAVNRPHESIGFEQMVEGLVSFRKEFPGLIWLEILLLSGVTANAEQMEHLVAEVERIRPDRVQLTTVVRPPKAGRVEAVPREELERWAGMFPGQADVVAEYGSLAPDEHAATSPEDVLGLLARHPCSMDDVAQGLGIHLNEVSKHVARLLEEEAIEPELLNGMVLYSVRKARHGG